MTPVFVQIKYFLNTVAIGLVIGVVFDLYRSMLFLIRPHKWTANILDICISILLTSMAFLLLLFSNWGEVRLYVFLGIGLGISIYAKYCSRNIFSMWNYWLSFLLAGLKTVFKIIFFPVKLVAKLLAFPLGLTSLVLYKIYRGAKPLLRKPGSKVKSLLKKIAKAFRRFKK